MDGMKEEVAGGAEADMIADGIMAGIGMATMTMAADGIGANPDGTKVRVDGITAGTGMATMTTTTAVVGVATMARITTVIFREAPIIQIN
jgi:hypothetical protein